MKLGIATILLGISVLLCAGCIFLPVPHERHLSPLFTGVIVDADTGQPLDGVKVTLRGYHFREEEVGPVVVRSDKAGKFSVVASRHTNWLPVWLGPAEGVQEGTLLFECDGYHSTEEKRSVFTGASMRTAFELSVRMKKGAIPPPQATTGSSAPIESEVNPHEIK